MGDVLGPCSWGPHCNPGLLLCKRRGLVTRETRGGMGGPGELFFTAIKTCVQRIAGQYHLLHSKEEFMYMLITY